MKFSDFEKEIGTKKAKYYRTLGGLTIAFLMCIGVLIGIFIGRL